MCHDPNNMNVECNTVFKEKKNEVFYPFAFDWIVKSVH